MVLSHVGNEVSALWDCTLCTSPGRPPGPPPFIYSGFLTLPYSLALGDVDSHRFHRNFTSMLWWVPKFNSRLDMVLVLKKETKASFFKSQRPPFNEAVHIYFVFNVALLKYNAPIIVAFVHSLYFLPLKSESWLLWTSVYISIRYLRSTSDIPLCATQRWAINTQKT